MSRFICLDYHKYDYEEENEPTRVCINKNKIVSIKCDETHCEIQTTEKKMLPIHISKEKDPSTYENLKKNF